MTVSWACSLSGFHAKSLPIIDYFIESADLRIVAGQFACTPKHVEDLCHETIAAGHSGPASTGMAELKLDNHRSHGKRASDDDGPMSDKRGSPSSERNPGQFSGKDGSPMNISSDNMEVHRMFTDHPTDSQDRLFAGDFVARDDRETPLPIPSASGENAVPAHIGIAATCNVEDRMEDANAFSPTRLLETRSNNPTGQEFSISLRAWLDNPTRVFDRIESLHLLKQVVEFVELAHCQGVVLRNVRPSSFLVSSMNQISIIESASSHTSSSTSAESSSRDAASNFSQMEQVDTNKVTQVTRDLAPTHHMCLETHKESGSSVQMWRQRENMRSGDGSADSTSQRPQEGKERAVAEDEGSRYYTSSSSDHTDTWINNEKFPLKVLLSMEMMWYRSPEELSGGTPDFPSDMYSLGVLFVELFYSAGSQGEWSRAMSDLRHRLLPPSLLLEFPKEAAFCLLLLHPNPNCRPKAREILHADIFSEIQDKLAEREAIMHLEEKLSEAETTLDFLLQMQQNKHVISQKLVQELHLLNKDVGEVKRWQALLMRNRWNEGLQNKSMRVAESFKPDVVGSNLPDYQSFANEEFVASGHRQDEHSGRRQERLLAKSAQLIKSFTDLRKSYLSTINRELPSGTGMANGNIGKSTSGNEHTENIGIMRFINTFSSSKAEQGAGARLGCFFDDFCQFMKYSKFDVKATLQYGDILNTKNMVCSLNFDCDDEYFATAGVSRRIKIFDCNALLEEFNDVHYPVIEMNSRKKLSCVCWNKFRKSLLCSSDLEGAVQLWDVTTGRTVMELKEHSKCAWSVDFSHFDSSRFASGSDDCCVKLWSTNQATSIGLIKTKANICSVQFSPHHSNIMAFGSADSRVYFHDLRYVRIPVCILTGHQKAVSFVRFAGSSSIVSASTDNTLKLWDLTKTGTLVRGRDASFGLKGDCMRTYTGHANLKNFVGLSVAEEGYIACGSETNEVFVYHKSLPVTMLSHKFKSADPISGEELDDLGDQFVSSVCWRNKSQVLVIANSVGNIQVLEMV